MVKKMEKIIDGYHLYIEDKKNQDMILWIMGEHEQQYWDEISKQVSCSLVGFVCHDWNQELSPWKVAEVKELQSFSGGGERLLQLLCERIIPNLQIYHPYQQLYIVGYSLAGLFSLYAFHRCQLFSGVASCSGSLWYPDFYDFVKKKPVHHKKIYLSLGNKEHRTRHPVFSTVKTKTEQLAQYYQQDNDCQLFFEQGNHFHNIDQRIIKAMNWLVKKENE